MAKGAFGLHVLPMPVFGVLRIVDFGKLHSQVELISSISIEYLK
jgi:hypothetical protein